MRLEHWDSKCGEALTIPMPFGLFGAQEKTQQTQDHLRLISCKNIVLKTQLKHQQSNLTQDCRHGLESRDGLT